MSPWIPLSVSVVVAALGLAGNAVLVAFFLGKLRATQEGFEKLFAAYRDFTAASLGALTGRMAQFDAFGDDSATDRARMNVRLDQLERGSGEARELRDELMKLSARADLHHQELGSAVARLRRTAVQMQRQIASMATGQAGVAFTTEPFTPSKGDPR